MNIPDLSLFADVILAKGSEGKKNDNGKAPLTLIPREASEGMAQAFAFGANKYGRFNFTKGLAVSRCLDAAMRHITASAWGEKNDPESSLDHLSHALASLAMAMYNINNHPELDDRYVRPLTNTTLDASIREDEANDKQRKP